MYRSLFAFSSTERNALRFAAGDSFIILERSSAHWWLATRCSSGETGYIPAAYVEKIPTPEQDEVLQSVDRAIEAIHNVAMTNGGKYNLEQRDVLQKLIHHRKETVSRRTPDPSSLKQKISSSSSEACLSRGPPENNGLNRTRSCQDDVYQVPPQPCRAAPADPRPTLPSSEPERVSSSALSLTPGLSPLVNSSVDSGSSHSVISSDTSLPSASSTPPPVPKRGKAPPPPPERFTAPPSQEEDQIKKEIAPVLVSSKVPDSSPSAIPQPIESQPSSKHQPEKGSASCVGAELVELVRKNTGLSYELSRVAVGVVVGHLQSVLPAAASGLERVLLSLLDSKDLTLPPGHTCHDETRLQLIFQDLARHRDDAQQRSWALHEDEQIISCYLQELLQILTDADPEVCRRVCCQDDCEWILSLVSYYQMEQRVCLRLLLLQVFGAVCALDVALISALLNSVLTLEVARELLTDTTEIEKMRYAALLMALIFSTGEQIPLHHYEHLNGDFLGFILDVIEDGLTSDPCEQLPDLFLNLLLSFNLHLNDPQSNIVMKTLIKRHNVKILSEKILLLHNRGEDPVCVLKHSAPAAPHSVLKFLKDVFSSRSTAEIFYSSDLMVMIDIAVRLISDLSPGDRMRTEHLSLMRSIMRSTDYAQHQHRVRDLRASLQRILQEDEGSSADQLIVLNIFSEFPDVCSP